MTVIPYNSLKQSLTAVHAGFMSDLRHWFSYEVQYRQGIREMDRLFRSLRIVGFLLFWTLAGLIMGGLLAHTVLAQESAAADDLETIEVNTPVDIHQRQLNDIEDYLNGISSLRARFIQQSPDGSLSRGVFHLQRPGRVRFEYEDDSPLLIVSDGDILSFIDYDVGQVSRWPIKDTPLHLLVDDTVSLDENITMVALGPGELANMLSVTAKDPDNPEQGAMTLIFAYEPVAGTEDTALNLRAWEVIDAQGTITTVTLIEPEFNLALERSLWDFEDPRGKSFNRRRRR